MNTIPILQESQLNYFREKSENKYVKVIEEIIVTELSYLNDLHLIIENFVKHFRDLDWGVKYINIFGNIEDLYEFNRKLVLELMNYISEPEEFSKIFIEYKNEFTSHYGSYCINYVSATLELESAEASDEFFKEELDSISRSLSLKLPLASYLLKPIQRILKYGLLLKSLNDSLKKLELPSDITEEGQKVMDEVSTDINRMKSEQEDYNRYLHYKEHFIDIENFELVNSGKFIREARAALHGIEMEVVIFERYIIIAEIIEDKKVAKAVNPIRSLDIHLDPKREKVITLELDGKKITLKFKHIRDVKSIYSILTDLKKTILSKLMSKDEKSDEEANLPKLRLKNAQNVITLPVGGISHTTVNDPKLMLPLDIGILTGTRTASNYDLNQLTSDNNSFNPLVNADGRALSAISQSSDDLRLNFNSDRRFATDSKAPIPIYCTVRNKQNPITQQGHEKILEKLNSNGKGRAHKKKISDKSKHHNKISKEDLKNKNSAFKTLQKSLETMFADNKDKKVAKLRRESSTASIRGLNFFDDHKIRSSLLSRQSSDSDTQRSLTCSPSLEKRPSSSSTKTDMSAFSASETFSETTPSSEIDKNNVTDDKIVFYQPTTVDANNPSQQPEKPSDQIDDTIIPKKKIPKKPPPKKPLPNKPTNIENIVSCSELSSPIRRKKLPPLPPKASGSGNILKLESMEPENISPENIPRRRQKPLPQPKIKPPT